MKFRETQRFRHPAAWLLTAAVAGTAWYSLVRQIILGKPFGTRPAPDAIVVVVWLVFGLGFPLLFWFLTLVTEVDADGVRVRFPPLPGRHVHFDEIKTCTSRRYRPMREFGGWGIRWGRHGSRAYNVSGDLGVDLALANGRHLLIGSRRADDLAAAISAHLASEGALASRP